jgi:vitamin B12 transporter
MIDRIEIVKGAASAAWGPALGGVVNIVTKSPDWERPVGGMLSGSIGKRATADGRLELSGAGKAVGYYLSGGTLRSDGLQPNNGVQLNHAYLKLVRRDEAGGTLTASGLAVNDHFGYDEGLWAHSWPVHDDGSNSLGNLSLDYSRPLAPRLRLDLDGHLRTWKGETDLNDRIDGENIPFAWTRVRESERGAGVRLTWGDDRRSLAVGTEYAHARTRSELVAPAAAPFYDKDWDRWEAYANGVLSIGPVTVLPGVRYDRTGIAGGVASATLGITWQATERTLLRAYGARGYGMPSVVEPTSNRLMKVYAAQAGFETADIPYMWFKGTWFYNRGRDIESTGTGVVSNQDRQGAEVEGRTVPWHGLSLTGGYTYADVRDPDTGVRVETDSSMSVPRHVVKAGLLYDDAGAGLRGTLTANWVSWNQSAASFAVDRGAVWDLHLSWKVRPQDDLSPELFASGRNLFSNVQTTSDDLYVNAPAWFEGGVRWRF